jgi:hypothetical protein
MARAMWARGAAAVTGCDASAPLLAQARAAEDEAAAAAAAAGAPPLGRTRYVQADALRGADGGAVEGAPFDVVHTCYLLQARPGRGRGCRASLRSGAQGKGVSSWTLSSGRHAPPPRAHQRLTKHRPCHPQVAATEAELEAMLAFCCRQLKPVRGWRPSWGGGGSA